MSYYGVYLEKEADIPHVYCEMSEVLDVLKLHKEARFREFNNESDANKFSKYGPEVVATPRHADGKSSIVVEKAAFRGPTKQELIEFRKIIESGDYERVKTMIWDNPRYLVSAGDTPTTLKEGYRYNAMHICAISGKPRIAELILKTVSDTKFVDLLTGKKNDEKMCKELCVNLLDYYLNIPEKGRSETPLHFAAKTGGVEMVELLTTFPECKMTPNSEGLYPKDIICARVPNAAPELKRKIEVLLEERFYVPVLRSVDNVVPPKIGQPFPASNPPNLNCDPLSAEIKIEALAGPMNKEQASQFCRRWKTPPRLGSNAYSPATYNLIISPLQTRCANGTPSKTSLANISNGSPTMSTPLTKANRRALFNSTPRRSSCELVNENGVSNDTSLIVDKQNGNHKNQVENMEPENTTSNSTATTNELEKNNNSREQLTSQDTDINILKNLTSQNTPVLQMKRELFFSYRDPHPNTPVERNAPDFIEATSSLLGELDISAIGENNENLPLDQPQPQQQTFKLKGSMLKTALCRKMPQQELFKNNFNTYRDISTASSPDSDCCNDSRNLLLNESQHYDSPGFKERHIKITDTEKGLELIGRELAREQNVEWREYWDFLNSFINIASEDGLNKLENYFAERLKNEEMEKKTAQAMAKSAVILDNVCNALEKLHFPENGSLHDFRNGFNNERARYSNMTGTGEVASTAPQSTTPYTYVEKSVQVFAKRMTKAIIYNIENMVSINDTLLPESKRLNSLICSFKEDKSFRNVNFSKVHSRIGNLISIYLANSQEVTPAMKIKLQGIIKYMLTPGERREHIECVCWRILKMLESPTTQILPEQLKTEEMCSKEWEKELQCECQWETNLSRKTSRRNRMEARYRSHQQARHNQQQQQQQDIQKTDQTNAGNGIEWRDPLPCTDADSNSKAAKEQWRDPVDYNEGAERWRDVNIRDESSDNEVFWSDFGDTDSDNEDEVWATPPESSSHWSLLDEPLVEAFKIFIYGNEPTKRDVDVLNAIMHIDIDTTKYSNIHAWKTAMLRYPKEEMDAFVTMPIVKKSQSFTYTCTPQRKEHRAPLTPFAQRQPLSKSVTSTPITANLKGKSLFTTQQLHSTTTTIINPQRALPTTTAKRFFARQTLANLLAPFHANNTH
ncbi:ankyrin repeat and LEM domain-containing protein 2 homolog isoform X1 [Zeugodacus cucurbitae]|uniref:Ankyrin repeat and LEM domain-containing protein 2 n=2 Tax=Zeugodacus cucurbitae TaxID=28588 RepID=A0A0A1WX70_ZEUCU|nr:ankyrin repeat and LEM domain-containing protein 2 homolog isoform X1 [Zeugodacus cucurbitae]